MSASRVRVLSAPAASDAVVIAAELPECAILRAPYHRALGSESSREPLGRSCGFSHPDGASSGLVCGGTRWQRDDERGRDRRGARRGLDLETLSERMATGAC